MQDLKGLIAKAQSGDSEAYNQIVYRFQDMAVAYAYSITGDFHMAQDASQEAFIEALTCLKNLREPLAFPGWLRRIVFKHCDRFTRSKRVGFVSLDAAREEASTDCEPEMAVEISETALQVRTAVARLPQHERDVVWLFYISGHSQKHIAEFLEVPVTTVKKRLHTARTRLKEMMIQMTPENFEHLRPSRNSEFAERVGAFTAQFSQMIDSGQSIVRSLAALAEKEQGSELSQIIAQIQRDITGNGWQGASLSEAMSKYPDAFTPTYIDMIRQGERNGDLASVLQKLSSHPVPCS